MTGLTSRRSFLIATTGLWMSATAIGACAKKTAKALPIRSLASLTELEAKSGGRLGVAILNTATGAMVGHRADERFGMCSTFKLALAAVMLREADQGRLKLGQIINYTKPDLLANSPITTENVDKGGMTIAALCKATQTTSDNTAANLLMKQIGGPAGLTAKLRAMGDGVTRIDRLEPEMNHVLPGEEHDTTTPAAMAQTLVRILTGDVLTTPSRARLIGWMIETETGLKRLRAGLPAGWKAGDKTGTGYAPGMPNRTNDLAIAWPPSKKPIIITSYYEGPVQSEDIRDEDQAVLAEVGRIAAKWAEA